MESTQEGIKQNVREHYTKAVTGGGSCCGCSSSGSAGVGALQRGRVVAAAGYTAEELEALPTDAVANSFGCGNPLAFAGVEPGQVVVDIGSGAGIDCLLAAQKVGPDGRVIGIDMTPVMIEKARENARDAGVTNAEFRLGDAESMPVEDGAADWIISNCVINLSPDKPKVFAEAYRVLKPGGRLSISDIMVEADLPWALRHSAELYASCVAGAIPESQYVDEIRKAGFSDVQVTERIVYDREMIMSLIADNRLLGTLAKLVQGSIETAIDRHVAGKIWSAKIVAKK